MWKQDVLAAISGATLKELDIEKAILIKEAHFPVCVYKYRPPNEYTWQQLRDDTVWLANVGDFNDPYDSAFVVSIEELLDATFYQSLEETITRFNLGGILTKEAIAAAPTRDAIWKRFILESGALNSDSKLSPERVDELIDKLNGWVKSRLDGRVDGMVRRIRESVKVSCFCEYPTSMLMWGHYADCHQGLCIEYPVGNLAPTDLRRRLMFPVVYSPTLFDATKVVNLAGKGESNNLFALAACLEKYSDWSYEREWRLVFIAGIISAPCAFKMPAPSAIYLGTKMKDSDKELVCNIARTKGIQLMQMRLTNVGGGLGSVAYPV